jgi:hypothetical protein
MLGFPIAKISLGRVHSNRVQISWSWKEARRTKTGLKRTANHFITRLILYSRFHFEAEAKHRLRRGGAYGDQRKVSALYQNAVRMGISVAPPTNFSDARGIRLTSQMP